MTSSQRSNRLFRRGAYIGILVVGSAILLMAIQNDLFEDRVTLRTRVASLAGIPANAPVRLNGILIGNIDKVTPSTSYDRLQGVEIDMKIYQRFLDQIPGDSKSSLYDTRGDKYISITRGRDPRHLEPNDEVQSVQATAR